MNSVIRALSGPILLTTLGVLLMVDYSDHASISRTWPVLLIVFGLCKILEYAGTDPHSPDSRGVNPR